MAKTASTLTTIANYDTAAIRLEKLTPNFKVFDAVPLMKAEEEKDVNFLENISWKKKLLPRFCQFGFNSVRGSCGMEKRRSMK